MGMDTPSPRTDATSVHDSGEGSSYNSDDMFYVRRFMDSYVQLPSYISISGSILNDVVPYLLYSHITSLNVINHHILMKGHIYFGGMLPVVIRRSPSFSLLIDLSLQHQSFRPIGLLDFSMFLQWRW